MRPTLGLLLTAALATGVVAGQQPGQSLPPSSGLILGQVIDAGTGRPIAGALVRLVGGTDRPMPGQVEALGRAGGPSAPQMALSNRDGRFIFRNLPPGSYNAAVTLQGYTPGVFGRRRLEGPARPIVLGENERVLDATVRLWKLAVITGTVTDEAGEPLVGFGVTAFRRITTAGRRRLVMNGRAVTDDRGYFRLSGLIPDEYLVAVPMVVTSVPVTSAVEYAEAMRTGSPNAGMTLSQQRAESGAPGLGGSGFVIGDQQVMFDSVLGLMGGSNAALQPSPDGRFLVYPVAYHGGMTAAQASVIVLESGDTRPGVDIRMRAVATVQVSGAVVGQDGPVGGIGVRLVPADVDEAGLDNGLESALTMTDGAGRFTFPAVSAGSYVMKAYRVPLQRAPVPTANLSIVGGVTSTISTAAGPAQALPTFFGRTTVTVGGDDLTDVSLMLRPGIRVTGKIEFDGAKPPPPRALSGVAVSLQPIDGRQPVPLPIPPGRLDAENVFTTSGYAPGRYLLNVAVPLPNWTVRSIQSAGVNLLERPLELASGDVSGIVVTFTDRIAELSGSVTGAAGPNDDVTVVVFPADYQAWFANGRSPRLTTTTLAGPTGTYQMRLPPPGDYIVVAVLNERVGDADQAYYAALSRLGTRVSVTEGEKKTLALTVSQVR